MTGLATRIETLRSLGVGNVLRVGLYRVGIKSRLHPVQRLAADPATGPFFGPVHRAPPAEGVAREDWHSGYGRAFGQTVALAGNEPPDWFSPLDGGPCANDKRPWWNIPDFDPQIGDIKQIWEASRFDWTLPMAQRAALGDTGELERLNDWLNNWSEQNRPYMGVNWKCGQEASIRVMHLVAAACILGQETTPELGLVALIRVHLRRIAPTLSYAIGQSNNHGTSEAAALFVGGSFIGGRSGARWAATGRRLLENRARVLIAVDGTFSQYSTVYHRVMLDSYSFAETWRRKRGLAPFSAQLFQRLSAATDWMEQMTSSETGEAPNLGANDGAQILAFTWADTRDFRPSLQLASTLFRGTRVDAPDTASQSLTWLGVPPAEKPAPSLGSVTLDEGGLHILRAGNTTAYLRYPRFRFRPSQADALHLDLWSDGRNLLRDAGTYSYNSTPEDLAYFPGTASHNTVQFGGRDQMPRVGRFLFAKWLRAEDVSPVRTKTEVVTAAAAYRDHLGARHHRRISLAPSELIVRDTISGFSKQAILRWRLSPGDYSILDKGITGEGIKLNITSSMPVTRIALVTGEESLYYLQKKLLPVLEVTFDQPGEVVTRIGF